MSVSHKLLSAALLGSFGLAFSVGCNPTWFDPETYFLERHGYIPSRALFVQEAVGDQKSIAPKDGRFYVYDPLQMEYGSDGKPVINKTDTTQHPVISFFARKGWELVVAPKDGFISVNGDKTKMQMYADHKYRIYFEPAGSGL